MKRMSPIMYYRYTIILFASALLLLAFGMYFFTDDAILVKVFGGIMLILSTAGYITGFVIVKKAKCPKCGESIRGALGTHCQFCGYDLSQQEYITKNDGKEN